MSRTSHQAIVLTFEIGGVKHYQAKNTFLSLIVPMFQGSPSSIQHRSKSNWTSDSTGESLYVINWSFLIRPPIIMVTAVVDHVQSRSMCFCANVRWNTRIRKLQWVLVRSASIRSAFDLEIQNSEIVQSYYITYVTYNPRILESILKKCIVLSFFFLLNRISSGTSIKHCVKG